MRYLTLCAGIVFWILISSAGYMGIGEQHIPPPKQPKLTPDLNLNGSGIFSVPGPPQVKDQKGRNKVQKSEHLDQAEKARIEQELKDEDDQIEQEIEKEVPPEPENPKLTTSETPPAPQPSKLLWFVKTLFVIASAIAGMTLFGFIGYKLDNWLRKSWVGGEDVIPGLFGLIGLAVGAIFMMWLLRWGWE